MDEERNHCSMVRVLLSACRFCFCLWTNPIEENAGECKISVVEELISSYSWWLRRQNICGSRRFLGPFCILLWSSPTSYLWSMWQCAERSGHNFYFVLSKPFICFPNTFILSELKVVCFSVCGSQTLQSLLY